MNNKILLINLGTPDDANTKSVRRYLKQFLNDARVIDLPFIIRWPLVNLFIIPFRYKKTAAAYQKIWKETGSPLLSISKNIQHALQKTLGKTYQVELGMRYGEPSISSALEKLSGSDEVTILPLFPQYSSAATGSAIAEVLSYYAHEWNIPEIHIKQDFYDQPHFIQAYADVIRENIVNKKVDKIIFSYHGLPERHIIKSDCKAQCDRVAACPVVTEANRFCYRAQCYATTRAIVSELGLSEDQFVVSFQSRLGRTPWIKPYTDLLLPDLVKQGVKNIAVVSPSFVADCLETLEEIDIRMRKQWMELGGEAFTFIPCVNDNKVWIDALAKLLLGGTSL